MSVGIEGFLGYGVTLPQSTCMLICEDFQDKRDPYYDEIIDLNAYENDSDIFFGVRLTEEDINRAMLNSNLIQEWKHKTWVAFHRVFAADVEMPEPRFVFTTRYW